MSTPRETQFAKFAALLWDELLGEDRYIDVSTGYSSALDPEDDDHKKYIEIIAKRSYDMTEHTVGYTLEYLHECGLRTPGSMNLSIQPSIPDMTALPEVSE